MVGLVALGPPYETATPAVDSFSPGFFPSQSSCIQPRARRKADVNLVRYERELPVPRAGNGVLDLASAPEPYLSAGLATIREAVLLARALCWQAAPRTEQIA